MTLKDEAEQLTLQLWDAVSGDWDQDMPRLMPRIFEALQAAEQRGYDRAQAELAAKTAEIERLTGALDAAEQHVTILDTMLAAAQVRERKHVGADSEPER